MSLPEAPSGWILVDGEQTVDNLVDDMHRMVTNQQHMSHTLQKLLSEVVQRLDQTQQAVGKLAVQVERLGRKIEAMEDAVVERDARTQNRKIRMHDAFTFTAAKSGTEGASRWI